MSVSVSRMFLSDNDDAILRYQVLRALEFTTSQYTMSGSVRFLKTDSDRLCKILQRQDAPARRRVNAILSELEAGLKITVDRSRPGNNLPIELIASPNELPNLALRAYGEISAEIYEIHRPLVEEIKVLKALIAYDPMPNVAQLVQECRNMHRYRSPSLEDVMEILFSEGASPEKVVEVLEGNQDIIQAKDNKLSVESLAAIRRKINKLYDSLPVHVRQRPPQEPPLALLAVQQKLFEAYDANDAGEVAIRREALGQAGKQLDNLSRSIRRFVNHPEQSGSYRAVLALLNGVEEHYRDMAVEAGIEVEGISPIRSIVQGGRAGSGQQARLG